MSFRNCLFDIFPVKVNFSISGSIDILCINFLNSTLSVPGPV